MKKIVVFGIGGIGGYIGARIAMGIETAVGGRET